MNANTDRYTENRIFLSFADFITDENKLYFSNRTFNALVIADRKSREVEELIPFDGEKLNMRELHMNCLRRGNKIIFLPQGNRPVHIYDIVSGKQTCCRMEGEWERTQDVPWYGHVWQDKIYLLPCGGGRGLWTLNQDDQVEKELWWKVESGKNYFVHGDINERQFYTLEAESNHLTVTDLSTREIKQYRLPDEKVFRIIYDGQLFWYITVDNMKIVGWLPEQGVVESYDFPAWDMCHILGMPYGSIHAEDGKIFLSSGNSQVFLYLNREENRLQKVIELPEFPRIYKDIEKEPFYNRIGDRLVCTFRSVRGVVVIDLNTMEAQWYQDAIESNEKVQDYIDRVLFQYGPLLMEEADWNLEKFLKHCIIAE